MTSNRREIANPDGRKFGVVFVTKPKHAILYDLAAKFGGIVYLAKELQVTPAALSAWINLRFMPRLSGKGGGLSKARRKFIALKLVELTGVRIEEIFPDYVREKLSEIPRELESRNATINEDLAIAADQRLTLPCPSENVLRHEEASLVTAALTSNDAGLSSRERTIVNLRYGLNGTRAHTLVECGSILRVTKERVCQIEATALRKLRGSLAMCKLHDGE